MRLALGSAYMPRVLRAAITWLVGRAPKEQRGSGRGFGQPGKNTLQHRNRPTTVSAPILQSGTAARNGGEG